MTEKRVVISMDSHVEFYVDTKAYLEHRWHEEFDYAVATERARMEATRRVQPHMGKKKRASGRTGELHWFMTPRPVEERLKHLDEDGIAGEFITVSVGDTRSNNPEFMHALTQAETRWFEEFFSPAAHRFRGAVAVTLPLGMDTVVKEIDEAHRHGIQAIMLAGNPTNNVSPYLPGYNSHHYDPMWAALQERNMAVAFHPGFGREKPLVTFAGSDYEPGWEALMFARIGDYEQALPQLMYGGVPQRYPNLKFLLVETHTTWVPAILSRLDGWVKSVDPRETSIRYELLPSEMWHRQFCACGPLETDDIDGRYEVGVANMAWGSDYPHSEGTWPISRRWLGFLFQNLTREETDLMVSGNAARLLGFDLDALADTPAAAVPWLTPEESAQWRYEDDPGAPMFRELVKTD